MNYRVKQQIKLLPEDEENIAYRLELYNDTSSLVTVDKIKETREDILINTPYDYKMAIMSLTMPYMNLPLFIPDMENRTLRMTLYKIRMKYKDPNTGITYTSISPLYVPYYDDTNTVNLYEYNNICDMVNLGFKLCFNDLKTKFNNIPPYSYPFMIWKPADQIFSIIAERTYDKNYISENTVEVSFNDDLIDLFDSFEIIKFSDGWSQIIIKNDGYNAIQAYPPIINLTDNKFTLPTWTSTILYPINIIVQDPNDSNYYKSKIPNINKIPSLNPTEWGIVSMTNYGYNPPNPWNGSTAYLTGDLVVYDTDFIYIATQNSTGQNPKTAYTYWDIFTGFYCYEMKQSFKYLNKLVNVSSIVLYTNSIPINASFSSPSNISGSNYATNKVAKVLLDKRIEFTDSTKTRTIYQYTPSIYEYYDITQNTPIKTFDFEFFIRNRKNELVPLIIGKNETISIQILFTKK